MWTPAAVVLRMGEDARLRFKVEDLAGELKDTRDEALKKRFERKPQRLQDRFPGQYEP